MDINNISANNFKGTFIFKPNSQQARDAVPSIVKQGRQIFHNINSEGDIVFVTKDRFDKRVCKFIESENLPFEYYPEISTKSGLDDQKPLGLKAALSGQDNCVVRNLKLLRKFLPVKNLHLSKQSEYFQEAINTLRLNTGNAKVQIDDKGVFFVRDDAKQRTIKSSGFRSGMSYIYIIPDDASFQPIERFLISHNGKQVVKKYETPNEWIAFNKAFTKALELN